jgi:predicted nucleotidyltransferase
MSIGTILFGQTRAGVLALLYGHPDESYFTRQIVRHLHAGTGAVQRELRNLLESGLITRRALGSQVFYQANQQSPVFAEMRALVSKTVGVLSILQSALKALSKKIRVAFVYGSLAQQREKADSDIDVMVIGDAKLETVLSLLSPVESTVGRSINPTVYSVAEFKSKLASKNHFVNAVLSGKKEFLMGNEDELRKMGRVRLA